MGNTDGCVYQYRCATVLYLLLMLAYANIIIIYRCVGTPGHRIEVVDSFNTTYTSFLSFLMRTVQLPVASACDSKMVMHTPTANTDISLER